MNVLELKCLRNLVGVTRMERLENAEMHRRARIVKEVASRMDQSLR